MPRTILIHLNVEVPDTDERAPELIVDMITGALTVGTEGEDGEPTSIALALYEEI